MELIIKKCKKCNAMVEVLKDCNCQNCGICCCGGQMEILIPNTAQASPEKHLPMVEVDGQKMTVFVNHVMEQEHFIEWIGVLSENKLTKVFLKPGDEPKAVFHYAKNSQVFAFCNKHELWKTEVK